MNWDKFKYCLFAGFAYALGRGLFYFIRSFL